MQTRRLGRTEIEVSAITLGCMRQGVAADDETRMRVLHAALDAGITSFDTAPIYDFGRSEELLGRAIRGRRDGLQILTKLGLRWDDPHGDVFFRHTDDAGHERVVRGNSRPESVRLEVERSLARLGLETIDLIQIHFPDERTPIEETMGELLRLRAEGKVRAIGVSNFGAELMIRAQRALGDVPLASNQVHYSLVERCIEAGVVPAAADQSIALLCYSPLEQGLLAGKLLAGELDVDDRRHRNHRFHPANAGPIHAALKSTLAPAADRLGVAVGEVALAWLLAQPTVATTIVGASAPEQVERNARAGSLTLSAEEVAAIRGAFEALRIDRWAGRTLGARCWGRVRAVLSRGKRWAARRIALSGGRGQ